jgi:hypothetical protein
MIKAAGPTDIFTQMNSINEGRVGRFEQRVRAITRSIIDHDNLKTMERLPKNGINASPQQLKSIIGYDNRKDVLVRFDHVCFMA